MPPTDDADVHSAAHCHPALRGQQEPMSCRPSGPPGTPTNTPALGDRSLASDEHLRSDSATLRGPHNSEPPITPNHEVGTTVEITTYAVAVVEKVFRRRT